MANNRPRSEEDTEAIMNRRKFLIESTLVGAGLSAALAGCKSESESEPKVCLSINVPVTTQPKPCLEVDSQPADDEVKPIGPQVCLSIDTPPEPPPLPRRLGPCLSPSQRGPTP